MLFPACELKIVIATTNAIPNNVNTKFLYFPFTTSFSSLITTGIAKIINPMNKELIAYILLLNKLDKMLAASKNPIIQPHPIFTKNLSAVFFCSIFPLNKSSNEPMNLS